MKNILKIILFVMSSVVLASVSLVTLLRFVNPVITPYMISKAFAGNGLDRSWYSFDNINENYFKCVIASEDSRFFDHPGFDMKAVEESIKYNKRHKNKKRGASTISMQTAKNTFLFHGRNFLRKGFEAYFTLLIEGIWGKKRILEVYANVVEVGKGKYGVGTASEKFFGKEPSKLNRRQASLITAVLPNPIRWSPAKPTNYISRRAYTVSARSNAVSLKEIKEKDEK